MTDSARNARVILSFTADHPGMFGRHRTARILTGNASEEDIDRVPTLPIGATIEGESAAAVLRGIDGMIAAGIICKSFGDRPRLCLTRKGWGYVAALELMTTMDSVTA